MSGLLDVFSRDAGQRRRAWLDDVTQRGLDRLQYYAGPGVPVQQVAEVAGMLNPINDLYHLQGATRRAYETEGPERRQNAVDAALAATTFLAPVAGAAITGRMYSRAGGLLADDGARAANAMAETFTSTSQAGKRAARDFAKDESGAIRAYHGSPHDFDRFSMDRIGTGEGAQAYGHGLYFAENEGVARSYRQALAPGESMRQSVIFRGDEIPDNRPIATMAEQMASYMRGEGVTPKDAFARMRRLVKDRPEIFTKDQLTEFKALSPADFEVSLRPEYFGKGRMYEVNIRARPEDFLDWDAPLSAQPQVARRLGMSARGEDAINAEALRLMEEGNRRAGRAGGWLDDPSIRARVEQLQSELDRASPQLTGREFYYGAADGEVGNTLAQMGHFDASGASQTLREAGIPGIRYLDAGSRGAGDGSRNFVVFDENLIEIVRKYGIAGAAAMLGVSAAEVQAAIGQPAQPQGLLAP